MALTVPTLETERLRLRPFADTDAEAVYALQSDAHVLRYWDEPPWTEPERAQRFLARSRQLAEDGTGVRLAIERRDDGAFLGWTVLSRVNLTHHSAALGYCFTESSWGQGYATEAAHALLTWAFDTLRLNRVQAEADTRNAASARVLEKLGFVREGMLREDCLVDDYYSDTWVFGLLRHDWRAADADGNSPPQVWHRYRMKHGLNDAWLAAGSSNAHVFALEDAWDVLVVEKAWREWWKAHLQPTWPFLYLAVRDDRDTRRLQKTKDGVSLHLPFAEVAAAEQRGELVPLFLDVIHAVYTKWSEASGCPPPPPLPG
jgi:RimJ/RimL family protein N-acetyltransferase